VRDYEFRSVLDRHDLVLRGDERGEGVEAGRLPTRRLSAHEEGHPVLDADPEICRHQVVAGLELDQLQDADRILRRFPDGEVAPFPTDIRAVNDVDTRSVREGRIYDGIPVCDRPLRPLRELDHEGVELFVVVPPDDRFQALEYLVLDEDGGRRHRQ